MNVTGLIPQLRTTSLPESIDFYVNTLGFELDFQHSDFYAGIRVGDQTLHLKLVDEKDPSIDFVANGDHLHLFLPTGDVDAEVERLRQKGVAPDKGPENTSWGTREFYITDNQGHTLCYSQAV
jgi:catechol 2,3-dioxygenase-like lactoylglutathione lyase family enzyme